MCPCRPLMGYCISNAQLNIENYYVTEKAKLYLFLQIWYFERMYLLSFSSFVVVFLIMMC